MLLLLLVVVVVAVSTTIQVVEKVEDQNDPYRSRPFGWWEAEAPGCVD